MIPTDPAPVPYGGLPPSPALIWERWNLDPMLLIALAALLLAYIGGAARAQNGIASAWRRRAFYTGWLIASATFISPLCALSVSLFSAHVAQQMILALIAAPLIMAGRPLAMMQAGLLETPPPAQPSVSPPGAACLFAAMLWFWHSPGPYAAAFENPLIGWFMHISLFGTALFLWAALLEPPAGKSTAAMAACLLATLQMGLLGALITLSPRPEYAPHAATTLAWGFSPLRDQQLGGALLFVPGCAIAITAALIMLAPARPAHGRRVALKRQRYFTAR